MLLCSSRCLSCRDFPAFALVRPFLMHGAFAVLWQFGTTLSTMVSFYETVSCFSCCICCSLNNFCCLQNNQSYDHFYQEYTNSGSAFIGIYSVSRMLQRSSVSILIFPGCSYRVPFVISCFQVVKAACATTQFLYRTGHLVSYRRLLLLLPA
jgi:hypothetical protein